MGEIAMSKICKEAGNRIRILREKENLSREFFSELTGISPKFLYEIEMGLKGFSADTLYKISKALKVSSDYLLSGHVIESDNIELMNILYMFTPDQIKEIIAVLKTVYKITTT